MRPYWWKFGIHTSSIRTRIVGILVINTPPIRSGVLVRFVNQYDIRILAFWTMIRGCVLTRILVIFPCVVGK